MKAFFDHERLDVYQMARRFSGEVSELLEEVPRGQGDSPDNLKRAAKSVTRNIAEGSGKWKIRDKVNFYHIVRGSAMDCAASLDELVDFGLLPEERIARAKEILGRVVAMLITMIRSLEARPGPDMGS